MSATDGIGTNPRSQPAAMSADVSEAVRRTINTLNPSLGEIRVSVPAMVLALEQFATALQEGSGALPASLSGGQGSSPSAIPTEPMEPLLADLERKALAATPGPWEVSEEEGWDEAWCDWHSVGPLSLKGGKLSADTAFIAAANPATVLKIIAAVRASEVGMEARQSRNETQPNQPRDREEG